MTYTREKGRQESFKVLLRRRSIQVKNCSISSTQSFTLGQSSLSCYFFVSCFVFHFLQIQTGECRYNFMHSIANEDLLSPRRLSMTFRQSLICTWLFVFCGMNFYWYLPLRKSIQYLVLVDKHMIISSIVQTWGNIKHENKALSKHNGDNKIY